MHDRDDPDYYGYPPWHALPDEADEGPRDPYVPDDFVPQPITNTWGGEFGPAGTLVADFLDRRAASQGVDDAGPGRATVR